MISKPIFPCLWYDGKAREAADFYCQIFPNSKILSDNGMVVKFELNGREFMGLNGGPNFKFDEAVSFCIECETQEEIDYYWENLLKTVVKKMFAVGLQTNSECVGKSILKF